jgi:hypothetical protein
MTDDVCVDDEELLILHRALCVGGIKHGWEGDEEAVLAHFREHAARALASFVSGAVGSPLRSAFPAARGQDGRALVREGTRNRPVVAESQRDIAASIQLEAHVAERFRTRQRDVSALADPAASPERWEQIRVFSQINVAIELAADLARDADNEMPFDAHAVQPAP